jgi:UbiD family decarboxylase
MRAYQDLREFLPVLEGEKQLLRIAEPFKFEPDLAAAACALAQIAEGVPAIQFNNIAGSDNAQVVVNVHGWWQNRALALGMKKDAKKMKEAAEKGMRKPSGHPRQGRIDRRERLGPLRIWAQS